MGEARARERLRLAGLPVPPPRERVTRYIPARLAGDLRAAERVLQEASRGAGRQITEDQAFAAILRAGLATLPPPEGVSRETSALGSMPTGLTPSVDVS